MIRRAFVLIVMVVMLLSCSLLGMQKDSEPPATFSVFQGEVDGHPLVAMIDMGLHNSPDKQQFPFFLSVSTHLLGPTSEGLPSRKDADNLNAWEYAVEAHLRSDAKFVFVGRVTWNGSRELLFYVNSRQPVVDALKKLSDAHYTRVFSFSCERDDKWEKANLWFNRK